MARNRYTRLVHEREEVRLNLQRRDLERLARELRSQPIDVVELPTVLDLKGRRRARLEQNRLHKPVRVGAAAA